MCQSEYPRSVQGLPRAFEQITCNAGHRYRCGRLADSLYSARPSTAMKVLPHALLPGAPMIAARKSLDGLSAGLMLILCACWGMQQVAIKIAAPGVGTILQTGVRSLIAALLVAALMLLRGTAFFGRDATLWPGVAAGLLFALEFLCVAVGLNHTTASHMVVFLYTAPIFTVLGLHWLVPGEHLRLGQWLGILIAFGGIGLAFSAGFEEHGSTSTLIGDGLGILAGVLWAATTILIRRSSLSEAAPTKTLLYQLGVSALVVLPLAAAMGQFGAVSMTPVIWASMVFQSVVVTFASYLAWFWILRRYLASRVSVFSFLTPLFGVGFGVLLLNETVGVRFATGAALVLGGIVLVNVKRSPQPVPV
ncbi:drug/metabolite transporter (DMT)-like permease [Actimicrobium sp. GrIS 1.19]|nr:drug/metabolite transporter (DMT)-like permease [Actimicrobium sp. GrIS 1.19]